MIYLVKVSISNYPFYAYEGKDKDLAVSVATSYIDAGKPTQIIERADQGKTEGK